jgi:hypothetical protein
MGDLYVCLQDQNVLGVPYAGGQIVDTATSPVPIDTLIANGLLTAPIIPPPGSTNNFLRQDGLWVPASGTIANQKSSIWMSPIFTTSGFATNRGVAANQIRACYMGRSPAQFSSIKIRWYTAAAAVAGWAEMAVAVGSPVFNGTTNLTIRGFVSAVAEWNNVNPHELPIPLTGADIQVGDELWGLYAMDIGTTQIRVSTLDPESAIGTGCILVRNATRPSLNLNTPLAFAADLVGATPPVLAFSLL